MLDSGGRLIAYGVTAVFQSDVTKVWLEERMDRYQYSVAVSDKIDASDATTLTLDDQSADVKIIPSNQLRVTRNITVVIMTRRPATNCLPCTGTM